MVAGDSGVPPRRIETYQDLEACAKECGYTFLAEVFWKDYGASNCYITDVTPKIGPRIMRALITHGADAEVSGDNLICGGRQGILVFFPDATAEIRDAVISGADEKIAIEAGAHATDVESDIPEEVAAARCERVQSAGS